MTPIPVPAIRKVEWVNEKEGIFMCELERRHKNSPIRLIIKLGNRGCECCPLYMSNGECGKPREVFSVIKTMNLKREDFRTLAGVCEAIYESDLIWDHLGVKKITGMGFYSDERLWQPVKELLDKI